MKVNFHSARGFQSDKELEEIAEHLASFKVDLPGEIGMHGKSPEYEGYHAVDVLGPEFVWMNNSFDKEKFVWYHWFESVFLVPDEMLPFLVLRWSEK